MAASVITSSRSGRYFKLYMFVWAMAAAAALAYLASLATNPDLSKPFSQQTQAEPDQSLRLASRALSEVGTVRRAMGELQRDVGQIKENIDKRETSEKAVQSRLAALEEKVTSLAQPPVAQAPAPAAPKTKAVEKNKDKGKANPQPERSTSRLSRVGDPPAAEKEPDAEPRVETGSLPPGETPEPAPQEQPQAPVVMFGAPTVVPTTINKGRAVTYGIQIGAGGTVEALRGSWGKLVSKHADALSALEPRYFAPRSEGGKYRLVAGPFASKEEAEKACANMGIGRAGCFSTTFGGEPL